MNLHGIVSAVIPAVNPEQPVLLRISTGSTTSRAGKRTPSYAVGAGAQFTGSLSGAVLTVEAVQAGVLAAGQFLLGSGVLVGSVIRDQLTGSVGGSGTYSVARSQSVPSGALASSSIIAQVQDLSARDLRHLEGLGIQGSKRAIYMNGVVSAVVRLNQKGGDLLVLQDGSTWLTTAVVEQWPDWVKVAVIQQTVP